jgi:hypothetical protein
VRLSCPAELNGELTRKRVTIDDASARRAIVQGDQQRLKLNQD